jgi:RimJ/RimL family protein N-acetyltransferase
MQTPTLESAGIRLEPLAFEHMPALEAVAFDPAIWKYMTRSVKTPADLRAWVQQALDAAAAGTDMPWVIFKKATSTEPEKLVGSTRLLDLDLFHRTVEIGHTWLVAAVRGTRVNPEVKLLQLTYTFETLDLLRVALKTHASNQRSQGAIRGIGAVYEGTFRNHLIMPDGSIRDSAWFSIIRKEWPEVKDLLNRRLNAPA